MICAKDLKELLKGVPDDAEIFIPSKDKDDEWSHCSKLEIHYEFDEYNPPCVDEEGKEVIHCVMCDILFDY